MKSSAVAACKTGIILYEAGRSYYCKLNLTFCAPGPELKTAPVYASHALRRVLYVTRRKREKS